MKSHLIVFDPKQIDKDKFRDTVDGLAGVKNWTLFFGNSMCVVSEAGAKALSHQIREVLPGVRFFISTIDRNEKDGWLPKQLWEFMNEPMPSDARSDA